MSNPTTADQLAAQLERLAESGVAELDADERQALQDAATRLRKGQGPVYVIGRLLAPFLGRLSKSKPTLADQPPSFAWDGKPRTPHEWDRIWGGRIRNAHRSPKEN